VYMLLASFYPGADWPEIHANMTTIGAEYPKRLASPCFVSLGCLALR
jgi:hypothetical protein